MRVNSGVIHVIGTGWRGISYTHSVWEKPESCRYDDQPTVSAATGPAVCGATSRSVSSGSNWPRSTAAYCRGVSQPPVSMPASRTAARTPVSLSSTTVAMAASVPPASATSPDSFRTSNTTVRNTSWRCVPGAAAAVSSASDRYAAVPVSTACFARYRCARLLTSGTARAVSDHRARPLSAYSVPSRFATSAHAVSR